MPSDLEASGLTDAVQRAFDAGMELLQTAGHAIHKVDFKRRDLSAIRRASLLICEAELIGMLAPTLASYRKQMPENLLGMLDFISRRSAQDIGCAVSQVVQTGSRLTRQVSSFDALLLPTAPQTAFLMDSALPHNQADLTAMANMSGAPSISLPLPVAPGELAVGLQLIRHRGKDWHLLRLALMIEKNLR